MGSLQTETKINSNYEEMLWKQDKEPLQHCSNKRVPGKQWQYFPEQKNDKLINGTIKWDRKRVENCRFDPWR